MIAGNMQCLLLSDLHILTLYGMLYLTKMQQNLQQYVCACARINWRHTNTLKSSFHDMSYLAIGNRSASTRSEFSLDCEFESY